MARQRAEFREALRHEVRKRLRLALKHLLPGRKVIVFGSLTHSGEFHGHSDIDLALFEEPKDCTLFRADGGVGGERWAARRCAVAGSSPFQGEDPPGRRIVDELGLITVRDEMRQDCRVAEHAWMLAQTRFQEATPSGLEGCAHHLSRLFNIIEQMAVRIAKAFENRLEEESGWHAELIRRLSIAIEGVRPPFFPEHLRQPLRELRAFRHVFTDAYDLELDRDKVALILKYASQAASVLPEICERFVQKIAEQEGLGGFHPGSD